MTMCMDSKVLEETRNVYLCHGLLERGASTKIQWVWLTQRGVTATKQ